MKKKILITGCGGYLGSYLMPFLIKKGYQVYGQDIDYFKDCNLFQNEYVQKSIQYKDSKMAYTNLNGILNQLTNPFPRTPLILIA